MANVVEFGLRMEVRRQHPLSVEVEFRLTRWPAAPSKRIIPIFPAVVNAIVVVPPKAIRPVKTTSAGAYGGGGTKKSPLLTALPAEVATVTFPDVPTEGTLVAIAVEVTELRVAGMVLNSTRLLPAVGSKLLPVIVTLVPAVAIVGVNPLMTGAPLDEVTVNELLLLDRKSVV